MGKPASADGGKGFTHAGLMDGVLHSRTSGAGESDLMVSVRANPPTEAAWSVTQPVRSGSSGSGLNWRKP